MTVTVVAARSQVVHVTATRLGTFRVTLDRVLVARCGMFGVRAVGSRGSVAALKTPPLPACIAA